MLGDMVERKTVVTVLFVSTILTVLGIGGMANGATVMSNAPILEINSLIEDNPPESISDVAMIQLASIHMNNPYRRPLAAIGFVISFMILIGSFMLTWRSKLAPWWITQAVVAKTIWIAGNTAVLVSQVQNADELPLKALEPHILPEFAEFDWANSLSASVILLGVMSVAVHALAAWRANKEDVANFIASRNA